MKKPIILVANDDGITASGIRALVEVAKTLGEVIVVAPDSPQSGMGHAITISSPIRLHPNDVFGDIEAYECSGTPVDCVKLAKHVVLKGRSPDLCVSGINHGSNASINIIYSGTLSAAMEASLEGIPSIGFSLLDYRHDANFEHSKPFVRKIMEHVLEHGMEKGSLLNVNLPKLQEKEIKGIKICRQADARWVEEFTEATDPRGQKYYWLTGRFENLDQGEDTDIWALENGYISVVPSMHDLTNYHALASLTSLEK
ncbi:MAG TPA: 5'/3'-nucleotidase SurE [Saprospiraceae bacterium]|mgnify:CR=1 FL=1|nr:5'/3'-nucleotidase SurE [Saprospiraceae bacterium]HMQ82107.1 5'/3'-nucleotidase SurE [Saprospiraceae bacterium]